MLHERNQVLLLSKGGNGGTSKEAIGFVISKGHSGLAGDRFFDVDIYTSCDFMFVARHYKRNGNQKKHCFCAKY